jgi:hypothetical protein
MISVISSSVIGLGAVALFVATLRIKPRRNDPK